MVLCSRSYEEVSVFRLGLLAVNIEVKKMKLNLSFVCFFHFCFLKQNFSALPKPFCYTALLSLLREIVVPA